MKRISVVDIVGRVYCNTLMSYYHAQRAVPLCPWRLGLLVDCVRLGNTTVSLLFFNNNIFFAASFILFFFCALLSYNSRDRSLKSPDGKIVSNFAILLVFPTTCDANSGLKIHKKIQGTQHGINIEGNDTLKLKMY